VPDQPVPFAPDDRNRRTDVRGIVGELAVPGLDDLRKRAERRLDAGGVSRAAFWIAVEVAHTPVLEMTPRQHRSLVRRHVLDEALPLVLRRDDAPGREGRRRLI